VVGHSQFAEPDRRKSDGDERRSAFYFFDPVRRRGSAKQCLWLGPGGYSCGCARWRHTYTNSDADGDSYAYSNTFSITYACTERDTDAHARSAQGYAKASADSASSPDAAVEASRKLKVKSVTKLRH